MSATAAAPAKLQADISTAEDALKQKHRNKEIVSGGHLFAKALKNQGVGITFIFC